MSTKVIKRRNIYSKVHCGEGCHGAYLLYNKSKTKGIKVFFSGASSMKETKEGYAWTMAQQEFNGLKLAHKAGLAPKPYELVLVKSNVGYAPAVIMQHVKGKTLSDSDVPFDQKFDLEAKLKKLGILHGDLHSENIMVVGRSKRLLAIDFALAKINKPKAKKRKKKK